MLNIKVKASGNLPIGTGQIASFTPPGIFIGTYNYPNVFAGPLAVADPEAGYPSGKEYGKTIEDVISLNNNVYRASQKTRVKDMGAGFTISLQESTMSLDFVDMELDVARHLHATTDMDRNSEAPMRSMVELNSMKITSNPRIPRRVDYFHGDTDLKAEDAVWALYKSGLGITYLEGVLSSGSLGIGRRRRLVPTRWSITAVDDIIYRNMKQEIIDLPIIPGIEVFKKSYLGNDFTIVLLPYSMAYEMQEMWNSGFSATNKNVSIDHEFMEGRKKYASNVGGAYYAARLAVFEYLTRIRRQASVIVLRTIGSEYYTPLGVWLVRETVRDAFKTKPAKYASVEDLVRNEPTGIKNWHGLSKVLRNTYVQKSIFEYI